MWMNKGKKAGWLCLPPEILKMTGMILIAAGILLIVIFIPLKYWMALIGMLLIAAGMWLRCC